ncbi:MULTISPECIES: hypothetical protein [Staphylococcus]|uniref:hypothetical protein n=1 Tax=Staphylococcus TaxID=1279 RepID=UPI00140409AA|nr:MULTISPECIES: hypothetical protein [Staphylococcus]MBV5190958.1 hypothetical protein [Staphylococcus chromogenes]MBW3131801.1 hypothetical protein [Staphylococcus chromogenes]MCD8905925.1 hypothetical protein [Staphylococcus chromogenes]NHM91459.1 hypothetical protein [Staphylococcus sp. 10602379]
MQLLKYAKIALLIVILAEEIRNARNYKKAIGKPFKVKLDVDTSEVVENIQKLKRSLK